MWALFHKPPIMTLRLEQQLTVSVAKLITQPCRSLSSFPVSFPPVYHFCFLGSLLNKISSLKNLFQKFFGGKLLLRHHFNISKIIIALSTGTDRWTQLKCVQWILVSENGVLFRIHGSIWIFFQGFSSVPSISIRFITCLLLNFQLVFIPTVWSPCIVLNNAVWSLNNLVSGNPGRVHFSITIECG